MQNVRVIPVLLLKGMGLYKSVKFKDLKYVGDPINAIKIFNEKEVDELVFLDIDASVSNVEPNYQMLSDIASECFMPLCYGGGIKSIDQIERILFTGVEKISINSSSFDNPLLVYEAAKKFGSSTIVVSIDVKKGFLSGSSVYTLSGTKNTKKNPLEFAKYMEDQGAGEILINSIDCDGTMKGYDLDLIRSVSNSVSIPVIACGGAGAIQHFKQAVDHGASAVAAGSFFVFQGKHRAVLITYPDKDQIDKILLNK
jgi:cyclase